MKLLVRWELFACSVVSGVGVGVGVGVVDFVIVVGSVVFDAVAGSCCCC